MAKNTNLFEDLHKKWGSYEEALHNELWSKHGSILSPLQNTLRHIAAGSLAVLLLISQPATSSIIAQSLQSDVAPVAETIHTRPQLISTLSPLLPKDVVELSPDQETQIATTLSEYFKLSVKAILDGKRLNRSYGYIGAEQHLMRFAGDTISSHFVTEAEAHEFGASGMAPGRGAWGYFSDSFENMAQKDIDREKYYIAVQTFLSPGWSENTNEMYAFFKYRKMLVINPENGKSMVVVIGDAGPAPWTGKHLGGSPEVMRYLERVDGSAKGPVLYFFIDDPEDKVPLGPIEIQ